MRAGQSDRAGAGAALSRPVTIGQSGRVTTRVSCHDSVLMIHRNDALASFTHAAIAWAAGGRGQPLVDAAAEALAAGVDSPTLRMLAGAPHNDADEEATDLAPTVFQELGVDVADRLSPAAIIEGARLDARRLLDGEMSPRALAQALSNRYVMADYPAELQTWMALDDCYDMIDSGVIAGSVADVDADVRLAAQVLADGRAAEPMSVRPRFLSSPSTRTTIAQRIKGLLRKRTP